MLNEKKKKIHEIFMRLFHCIPLLEIEELFSGWKLSGKEKNVIFNVSGESLLDCER